MKPSMYIKIVEGDPSRPDPTAVPKLIRLGMTSIGARELVSGKKISNAKDRQLVAAILTAVVKRK